MMKILMLASGTPNSRLTYRAIALGRELVQRGHCVTMIAPSFDRHSNWQLDRPDDMGGIRMIYPLQLKTKFYVLNLIPYLFGALFAILRQRSDIIYLFKPTPATILGVLGKRLKRTPLILDMDDLGSEVMKSEGHSSIIVKIVAMCERLAARSADGIVAVSRLLEREYRTAYPNKCIMRLPNGVDPEEIKPTAISPEHTPKVIWFGMLGRPGILTPIIKAMGIVAGEIDRRDIDLEILGDGAARSELERVAEKNGVGDIVHFRGWATFEQLVASGQPGDIAICVTPKERTTEACSNQKIFQYMSLEWASIVSNVGDLPLYVDNGKAGLVVEADDAEALARAIIYLLKRPSKRMELGRYGRSLATGRYAWSNLAKNLQAMLEEVA